VSLANRMTIASPLVSARTMEAGEFPALAQRFGVQGVPRTVVNEQGAFTGALPEPRFVEAVLRLAGVPDEADEGEKGEGAES
jgi:predicted DsbA family dithiol-disulfide isomerase